ncbi:MAG: alkaline phosphatase D family protein [Litorimonas sp.]
MPKRVDWPNALDDIVMLSFAGPMRRQFTLRPRQPGRWRLLVRPVFPLDLRGVSVFETEIASGTQLPELFEWEPPQGFERIRDWSWSAIRLARDLPDLDLEAGRHRPGRERSKPIDLPLHERSSLADQLMTPSRLRGRFKLFEVEREPHSFAMWSCHQPFEGKADEPARIIEGTRSILEWYARRVEEEDIDVVYALGDTAYSDGCPATNFVDEYYSRSGLGTAEGRASLRNAYQDMYRHYWSFDAFQSVQRSRPHICIWDDHELRDGSGSEAEDFEGDNPAIREAATQVARAYILDQGPRVRPARDDRAEDAHKAYRYGSVATFVFDGRSSRAYHGQEGKVVSDQQMADFERFCHGVARDETIRYLCMGTAVPFINLKDFLERLGSEAPKALTDLAMGIRDDVRDSWHSPGNQAQLKDLMAILRETLDKNEDCTAVNLSGDIHISNAFSFQPPGFRRACYQITSSALTNRQHLPGWIGEIFETGTFDFSEILGVITRIWTNERNPNFLTARERDGLLSLRLNVFNAETGEADPTLDQEFTLGLERFGIRRVVTA